MSSAFAYRLGRSPRTGRRHEAATVSALMSTYAGESAKNLAESLESVYAQTVVPDQLVLVVDGPIDDSQHEIIAQYRMDRRIAEATVVQLASNVGLARALNAGLERCTGQFVMRMDSDDRCDPSRLELQINYFKNHPEFDIVTSWCTEFFDDGTTTVLKSSPVGHDAVVRALRWRNVLVHPSLLIRTETLRGVGGYRSDFGLLEDYDLYIRLVLSGAKFHVIPKVLVQMRISISQRRRRGGLRYCMNEIMFRFFCFRTGFLSAKEFFLVTCFYAVFRLAGWVARDRLYVLARVSTPS